MLIKPIRGCHDKSFYLLDQLLLTHSCRCGNAPPEVALKRQDMRDDSDPHTVERQPQFKVGWFNCRTATPEASFTRH